MVEELFGRYRLEELLGRGGMGEVYRAYDTIRNRSVALKRLAAHLASDPPYQARFRREAEIAARLTEPHVIPIHDFGEIDGQLFIDMRLVVGTDLERIIADYGPLPAHRAVNIIAQIASALAAAHAESLTHRDIKPSNVLLTNTETGEDYAYLIDFGIAHSPNATTMTAEGAAVGTLAYMAPERFLGSPLDHRVDIYALGCLLYEALTATRPWVGQSPAELMYGHLNIPPPLPSETQADIPAELDTVVVTALAKDPAARYQSASELAAAARRAVGSNTGTGPNQLIPSPTGPHRAVPISANPTDIGVLPQAHPRRLTTTRVITAAAAGVCGLAILTVAIWGVPHWRDDRHPPAAGAHVAATISTQPEPWGIAISPDGEHGYVTNGFSDSVSLFDTLTNTIVHTIPVGKRPHGVVFTPDGKRAYVTNLEGNSVSVLDAGTNAVTATIPLAVRTGPDGIAVAPDGRHAYITNDDASSVTVLDTSSNTVTASIPVGRGPDGVAITPDGQHLYVANQGSASVTVIETASNEVTETIQLGPGAVPVRLAMAAGGTAMYVTNSHDITVINTGTDTVSAQIPVGVKPAALALTPDGRHAYVGDATSNTVTVIDTASNAVSGTIQVGQAPRGIAFTPDGAHAYVTNSKSQTLSVINTAG